MKPYCKPVLRWTPNGNRIKDPGPLVNLSCFGNSSTPSKWRFSDMLVQTAGHLSRPKHLQRKAKGVLHGGFPPGRMTRLPRPDHAKAGSRVRIEAHHPRRPPPAGGGLARTPQGSGRPPCRCAGCGLLALQACLSGQGEQPGRPERQRMDQKRAGSP